MLIKGDGLNKQGASVCIGRGGGSSAVVILLVDVSRGNKVSKTIS